MLYIAPVLVLAVVLVVLLVWRPWRPRFEVVEEPSVLTLVLLETAVREIDAATLRDLAAKAWGIPVLDEKVEDSADRPAFLIGERPTFLGQHPDALFLIHVRQEPFFDDPTEVAEHLDDPELRTAIRKHTACTAIDVLEWFGDGDPVDGAHRIAAPLIEGMLDDATIAVLDTASGRGFVCDANTASRLRSAAS